MYYRYKSVVGYVMCKYFLQAWAGLFILLTVSCPEQKFLIFEMSHLHIYMYIFLFVCLF